MEDFCKIKGSLVDLKFLLEINGYVPFVWKQDSNLKSVEQKLIEEIICGLKGGGIKLICYNYRDEKFEIEDLFYVEYYYGDRKDLPNNAPKRFKIMHRVLTLRTSDEDVYRHKFNESIDNKKNYKKILDILRLSTVGNRVHHEGVPNTFHQFDPFVEFPTIDMSNSPDLCPVMYYIKMS